MDVCDDCVFHFLVNDLKSPKFIFRVGPSYLLVPNKSSKTCIQNGGSKSLQFRPGALGEQFHPSIREITDGAGDFKAGGDGFGGVTKADTLHAAGVKHKQAPAGMVIIRWRHIKDEAKGSEVMQCFLAKTRKFLLFGLTG